MRSNIIAVLKEQLKELGFIEDCTDTAMEVTPEMRDILEQIKEAKKTPSLKNSDLSASVSRNKDESP